MIKRMKTNTILTLVFSFFAAVVFSVTASAQEPVAPAGYVYVDSLIYVPNVSIDSTLVDKDIFLDMPSEAMGADATVTVGQSELIEQSMRKHVEANQSRTLSGYRVRIFFDNKQTARNESEQTVDRFRELYKEIAVYRTYTNPYFKVTVGDCRTRSEAMHLLSRIKRNFPSAFVVKENIECPLVDDKAAYRIDTVKVLKPIVSE
jgi:hypothetical protein